MITKRDSGFINLASRLAEDVDSFGSARVFAIITIGNKIISFGNNSDKKHPFAKRFSRHEEAVYFHAEVAAIHNAARQLDLRDWKRTTLYVARVKMDYKKRFSWGCAKPCSGCDGAIEAFGIRRVVWTGDNTGEILTGDS